MVRNNIRRKMMKKKMLNSALVLGALMGTECMIPVQEETKQNLEAIVVQAPRGYDNSCAKVADDDILAELRSTYRVQVYNGSASAVCIAQDPEGSYFLTCAHVTHD